MQMCLNGLNGMSDGGLFKLWVLVLVKWSGGQGTEWMMGDSQSEASVGVTDQSEARCQWSELRTRGTE